MRLYFYQLDTNRGTVCMKSAEVVETEKTYTSAAGGYFPFMYKRRLLKTELRIVTTGYLTYTCVLDKADPAEAKAVFREYLNSGRHRAEAEVKRWDGYLKSLEGAKWTEKP